MKKTRSILMVLIMVLCFSIVFAACGKGEKDGEAGNDGNSVVDGNDKEDDQSGENDGDDTGEQDEVDPNTDVEVFLQAMDDIAAVGDELVTMELQTTADSYYAFAGASVSSLRFAVEYILWLKGEGDTLANFTKDSRYVGFDQIAAISYASPYPYYFEGLMYHVQAMLDEAEVAYMNTVMNPAYPEDGVNFYYLKNMEVAALYTLRDELRLKEDEIYGKFTPNPINVTRDPYLFEPSYLLAKSAEAIEIENYTEAAAYAKIAVQNDPFELLNLKNATICCMSNDEWTEAAKYLDLGLLLAPEDEDLKKIYESLLQFVEE